MTVVQQFTSFLSGVRFTSQLLKLPATDTDCASPAANLNSTWIFI